MSRQGGGRTRDVILSQLYNLNLQEPKITSDWRLDHSARQMSTRSCGKGLCQVPNRPGLPKAGTRWSMRRIRVAVRRCGGLFSMLRRGVGLLVRPDHTLPYGFHILNSRGEKSPSSKSWLPFSCWCLGQKWLNPPRSDILACTFGRFRESDRLVVFSESREHVDRGSITWGA